MADTARPEGCLGHNCALLCWPLPVRLLRLAKIVIVSLRFGPDRMVLTADRSGQLVRLWRIVFFWRRFSEPRAVRLRRALESLGPIFVVRADAVHLPRSAAAGYRRRAWRCCKTACRPSPAKRPSRSSKSSTAGRSTRSFAEFERTPVASASVAQVQFARLQDGTEVAIKGAAPGIERVIAHDMALLDAGATLLDRLWPEGRRLKPREISG